MKWLKNKLNKLFMNNLLPTYRDKITASVDARKYSVLSLTSDNTNVYAQVQSHVQVPIGTYIVSTGIISGDVDSAVYLTLHLATGGEYKR